MVSGHTFHVVQQICMHSVRAYLGNDTSYLKGNFPSRMSLLLLHETLSEYQRRGVSLLSYDYNAWAMSLANASFAAWCLPASISYSVF